MDELERVIRSAAAEAGMPLRDWLVYRFRYARVADVVLTMIAEEIIRRDDGDCQTAVQRPTAAGTEHPHGPR